MKSSITIKLKKRSQTGWLVWILLMMPFLFGLLNDLLGLSHGIRYLMDVAWLCLAFFWCRFGRGGFGRSIVWLGLWVILFAVFTLLVYLVQYQSVFYYLWGLRNNFRFFVAFFAFAAFLSQQDVKDYFRLFDILFWLNVVVSLFQYFVLELEQDFLGGLFGTEEGCNSYTNIFFLIMITKALVFYLEKREGAWSCVSKCVAALLVAAMAELKFFFLEFIAVIALSILITNFTWRKFWVIVGGIVGVAVGVVLLANIFPMFQGWLSLAHILSVATSERGYTSTGDLNRLNAISQINDIWLTEWNERIFGLGLGNCDTSRFAHVNTPFYETYGDMHYTWMSHAFLYLETGYLGLIFYFGFFLLVYLGICRIEKDTQDVERSYCRISRIMALCSIIIAIYNASLRAEAGYMMYFVLAIPFAINKNEKRGVTTR